VDREASWFSDANDGELSDLDFNLWRHWVYSSSARELAKELDNYLREGRDEHPKTPPGNVFTPPQALQNQNLPIPALQYQRETHKHYLRSAIREMPRISAPKKYINSAIQIISTSNYVGYSEIDIRSLLSNPKMAELTVSDQLALAIDLSNFGFQSRNNELRKASNKKLRGFLKQLSQLDSATPMLNVICAGMYRDVGILYSGVSDVAESYCKIENLAKSNRINPSFYKQFTYASLMAVNGERERYILVRDAVLSRFSKSDDIIKSETPEMLLHAVLSLGVGEIDVGNYRNGYRYLLFSYANFVERGDYSGATVALGFIGRALILSGEEYAATRLINWLQNSLDTEDNPASRVDIKNVLAELHYLKIRSNL
jgi:hypothetical protein